MTNLAMLPLIKVARVDQVVLMAASMVASLVVLKTLILAIFSPPSLVVAVEEDKQEQAHNAEMIR